MISNTDVNERQDFPPLTHNIGINRAPRTTEKKKVGDKEKINASSDKKYKGVSLIFHRPGGMFDAQKRRDKTNICRYQF